MRHLTGMPNLALAVCRQGVGGGWANVFVADLIGDDSYVSNRTKERGSYFPLYLCHQEGDLDRAIRTNLNAKLYAKIRKAAGLSRADASPGSTPTWRQLTRDERPDEVKVFDYMYGVLHSPSYRETYAEFLRTDFPRVPFPGSPEMFRRVSELGEALRRLHLMEDAAIGETPYPFRGDGDCVVDKPFCDAGRVWINSTQYFDNVPEMAWDFPIGGYRPAQKWLKDRRGRALSWEDVRHYQRVIKVLVETGRVTGGIDLGGALV